MTKKEIEIAFKRWRADAKRFPSKRQSGGKTCATDYDTLRFYVKRIRWPLATK